MAGEIKKPHGMVLITGPTGSGKSTTLLTMLGMINDEGVNISTLEDPVEYFLPGVNQSQIRPEIKFTFANGLRALLRQDPNVIMVGEIRDQETGELAVHAALTGHLILSTIHTNDAIGVVPRLTVRGILQRVVDVEDLLRRGGLAKAMVDALPPTSDAVHVDHSGRWVRVRAEADGVDSALHLVTRTPDGVAQGLAGSADS